jgi:hypothetical protein
VAQGFVQSRASERKTAVSTLAQDVPSRPMVGYRSSVALASLVVLAAIPTKETRRGADWR